MNREEAVKVIENMTFMCNDTDYDVMSDAVSMAIEALNYVEKNKQTIDLINIFAESFNYDIAKNNNNNLMHNWIPCSERLPYTNDKVLVTIIENEYGDIKVYFGSYIKSIQLWMVEDRASYFTHVEVTAWMPLPEPYKAESE